MATEAQVRANKLNCLKSTGPKTAVGKMISSRNSTRHGFYSTSVLLPEEDKEEFLRFARRLVSAYAPCGILEEEAVKSIIETRWQLRRANVVDSQLFEIYGFYQGQHRGVGTAFAQDATQGNAFTKLTRYQSFLLHKLRLRPQKAPTHPGRSCAARWSWWISGQLGAGIATALERRPADLQAASHHRRGCS